MDGLLERYVWEKAATLLTIPYTVYSRYIAVVYITESDISRSHVGPHFLATHFANFEDMAPKSEIFREIAVIPWTPFVGDSFSRKRVHRGCLWSGSQETIFREICSGPVWLTCEMRGGTHAVRWPATEDGSLTPPLYHTVGHRPLIRARRMHF